LEGWSDERMRIGMESRNGMGGTRLQRRTKSNWAEMGAFHNVEGIDEMRAG